MKAYIKLICAGLLILTGISFAYETNESPVANQDIELQKYRIEEALHEALISWLNDANEYSGIECDRLADSLLSMEEPDVRSYFIAAQIAKLRQKPEKAIAILEDAVSKYPNETAPIGIIIPVKIVGRLWIATLARQSGNITKAKNIYETLLTIPGSTEDVKYLENKGVPLRIICYLYLAEIDSLHLKSNDLALSRLETVKQIEKPAGYAGEIYEVYKHWAAYEHTRISRGKAQATQQLILYPEFKFEPEVAVTQLFLSGFAGEPIAGSAEGLNITTEILVNQAVENTASPIDRNLARLGYGYDQQYKRNFTKAEKHYSALYEDDSFFSPVAGLYLAQCKKAQDKNAEADNLLEQVRTKYPGYESAVTELKESWKKEP